VSIISGAQALNNMKDPKASWSSARRRIRHGSVVPLANCSFKLKKTDTVLTLGSCFARNIEEHLVKIGCRVPTTEFVVPENERVAERAIEILSLFTPPCFDRKLRGLLKFTTATAT
jgi:hypothetical protein